MNNPIFALSLVLCLAMVAVGCTDNSTTNKILSPDQVTADLAWSDDTAEVRESYDYYIDSIIDYAEDNNLRSAKTAAQEGMRFADNVGSKYLAGSVSFELKSARSNYLGAAKEMKYAFSTLESSIECLYDNDKRCLDEKISTYQRFKQRADMMMDEADSDIARYKQKYRPATRTPVPTLKIEPYLEKALSLNSVYHEEKKGLPVGLSYRISDAFFLNNYTLVNMMGYKEHCNPDTGEKYLFVILEVTHDSEYKPQDTPSRSSILVYDSQLSEYGSQSECGGGKIKEVEIERYFTQQLGYPPGKNQIARGYLIYAVPESFSLEAGVVSVRTDYSLDNPSPMWKLK